MKNFLALAFIALSASAFAQAPAACNNLATTKLSAADFFKAEMVNDNFRVEDFVFVNGDQGTKAVEAAQAKYNKLGASWNIPCNGVVTVFVEPQGRTWDQVEDIYNRIVGYYAFHLGASTIRPLNKQDVFSGN